MTATAVYRFDRAIVRAPGCSVVDGIRSDPASTPRFDGVVEEHAAYVAALRSAGVTVDVLDALEDYPDSIFVEDPALVFGEGAIVLRPGAPSRFGEAAEMRRALQARFERVLELDEGGFADGGDVLVTPEAVFIGLSLRTNHAGAASLSERLGALGRKARIVETPKGVLHFKTAVSLLSEDTVLVTAAMAKSSIFAGYKVVPVADGEDGAANALRINDTVFAGDCYPRTLALLAKEGFVVQPLAVTQIAKLDAGLSCMSLRWRGM